MTNQWLQYILHQVIKTVERVGVLLAQEYVRPGGRRGSGAKADIDIEIEMLLRAELLTLFECDWLGEETGHVLTGHPFCSVVDPNDGTSDFLRGLKGSALPVGLLNDSKPVLGVVHAPVTPSGVSDSIAWAKGMWHLIRNGQRISVDLSNQNLFETSMLMVSAAADSKSEINKELCAPAQFHAMPSIAYRLARVEAGDGICGISLYPVGAHDVVAGHAQLIGAKGVLVGDDGNPVKYATEYSMSHVSKRVFGGAPLASADLFTRQWNKVLQERSRNPLAT